jgi:very-short-patch-repair endonuclease/predicted transcriptional regulator of viral defense system
MSRPTQLVRHIAAQNESVDRALAALAALQHGVVARWQLLALGFTRDTVQKRIEAGRFHPIHRGVYAVGHAKLTLKGHWMAAVLAGGPDALLSHRCALGLWQVRAAESGLIDVTVPGPSSRKGPSGIRLHSTKALHHEDLAVIDGIPVTSLARTILDYASVAGSQRVRQALEKVERMGLLIGRELDDLLTRNVNHRGANTLKTALADLAGPAPWTQSELEDRFLALIREAGLPEPELNVVLEGELVDALWRDARLVVEVDGYEFHKSRSQFEADRRRDAKLLVAGYRVTRLTQPRIEYEPCAVDTELRALLGVH